VALKTPPSNHPDTDAAKLPLIPPKNLHSGWTETYPLRPPPLPFWFTCIVKTQNDGQRETPCNIDENWPRQTEQGELNTEANEH